MATYKIVMAGDWFVGKEALACRFSWNTMAVPKCNIAFDFFSKDIQLDGMNIHLQIWDMGSQAIHRNLTRMYCRGVSGIMLVYDITKEKTFESIPQWMENLEKNSSLEPDVDIMLLGNKCDLNDKRQVSREQGEQLAEKYGIKFFETSAKEKINVDDAFLTLVRDIKQKMGDLPELEDSAESGPGEGFFNSWCTVL